MSAWTRESPLGDAWDHLDDNARKPGGTDCPACGRKVSIARRRINKHQAETFLAIGLESHLRRSQSSPRPWIHVEHDLIAKDLAPRVGRDWSFLKFWGLIEPATDDRNPGAANSGLWRLTVFGEEVYRYPRVENLRAYIETFNNKRRGQSPHFVSFASCLGRAFEFDEEIRRAS